MSCRRIVLAVSLLAILFAIPAAAGSASAATSGACPSSPKNFLAADNVGANFVNSGNTTTYFFSSLTDESPSGGVPGLVKYCVYPGGPKSVTAVAVGADGEAWLSHNGSKNFSFVRPGGDKSNIPLDGTTDIEMGTADWGKPAPANQTILLHINDPAECANLYGGSVLDISGTCFVKPSAGPDCSHGDPNAAYNANPFGVLHCPKSAIGFEATATNEFGDEVKLAKATTGTSLTVEFNSYGCGDSGHWFNSTSDTCMTTPGENFTIPITANIYDPSDLTTPLANGTVTVDKTIPFRPSADPTNCPINASIPDQNPGQWFDALAPVGSQCKNSWSILLTFNFPSLNLASGTNYVWTVAFNTTHSGYVPIGESTTCFTTNSNDPGCGYDSLNVGDQSFTGAPYSGIDVAQDIAFISFWMGGYPPPFDSGTLVNLESQTGWTGLRPLGEIF